MPPPTSVFNCFDVYDAMAEHITENSTDGSMLVDNIKKGQTVKLDADHVDPVHLLPGQDNGYSQHAYAKGWVCKACKSGIHVDNDGTMHIVSRDRDENMNSRYKAESSVISSREDGLTMGSMLNLPVYSIPNCKGCNCLKGLSGSQLKEKLTNSQTKKHYMTDTREGKSSVYDKRRGGYLEVDVTSLKLAEKPLSIDKADTCVFVPPVPHSCTYRPDGHSQEENNLKELKGRLYCQIRDELRTYDSNPSKDKFGKITSPESVMEMCEEGDKKFPKPEVKCYPELNHGFHKANISGSSGTGATQR